MKSIFTRDSDPSLRAVILIILSIALMILDKRDATLSQFRAAMSIPLVPLEYMVNYPIKWIDTFGKVISSHDTLLKENLDLKAERLLLKAQVQRLMALESENNQLKTLVHSSTQIQGKVLVAELLAVDIDPTMNQVLIDKGARDEVFVGQPVLDANGVMGKIIQVGPLTSRVLLVNDPHSGVPVQIARNGVRAIAIGDNYTKKLRLINVPLTADIIKGDTVVTSGLGQNFPEGYPVGQITRVIKDPAYQFAIINVEPSARIDRSREVLLVWPNKIIPAAESQKTTEVKKSETASSTSTLETKKPEKINDQRQ